MTRVFCRARAAASAAQTGRAVHPTRTARAARLARPARAPRAAALAVVLAALAGCAGTTGTGAGAEASASPSTTSHAPLAFSNCGFDVVIPSPPQRVVAIKSTSIEMMLALGLRDRIVGVGFADGPYADAWAPADPPPVLSDRVPSQEAVLALAPDLVYAGWESNLTADGAGDRATLARLGTATLVSPSACREAALRPDPLTWDDLWAEISLVGDVFGVPDRAGDLVAGEKARLAAVAPDGRGLTALWYSSGSDVPYVGAGIGAPELIMDAVGLRNIAADVHDSWASLSWEAVVDADPDVIVLVDSAWGSTQKKIAQLEGNPATAALSAVRAHRYLIVPFAAGEAGVRTVEAVETLAAQLAELPQ